MDGEGLQAPALSVDGEEAPARGVFKSLVLV